MEVRNADYRFEAAFPPGLGYRTNRQKLIYMLLTRAKTTAACKSLGNQDHLDDFLMIDVRTRIH